MTRPCNCTYCTWGRDTPPHSEWYREVEAGDARFPKVPLKKKLLLAAQRLEITALINDSALNPLAFHWAVADSQTTSGTRVTKLEYRTARDEGFFQFDHYRHRHYALYAGDRGDEREEHFTGSWPNQAWHVHRWIAGLEFRCLVAALPLTPTQRAHLVAGVASAVAMVTARAAARSGDQTAPHPVKRATLAFPPVVAAKAH